MEPEEILGLSAEELSSKIEQFRADLDAALAVEDPTAEDVEKARNLNQSLSALEAEATAREERATEFASLREAQTARTEAAAQREQAAAEPEGEEDPEGEGEEEDDEDDEGEDEQPAQGKGKVTASARSTIAKRRSAAPPPEEDEEPAGIAITAAADVPGFSTGATLTDLSQVGEAAQARMKGFPKPPKGGIRGANMQRYGVAQFNKVFEEDRIARGGDSDFIAIENAVKESRLQGGGLVAAGGWCAPSETLYDLCANESTEGIIDLPEFQVTRGGVRYTSGVDFSSLYDAGFRQTEAEAIAGETKPCLEIECPDFEEVRLDASGICIRVPLLTQAGYPELVRNTTERALIAYQHKQSADLVADMLEEAGTAVNYADASSTVASTLSGLEAAAERIRSLYRLPLRAAMEVVLPTWARAALRADLASRRGVDMLTVSDQALDAHLAARNLRVQYVYGMGDEGVNTDLLYPEVMPALVYPAGTFVKGTAAVISLDAVYDAASLAENMYTGLFFEEGILLLRRCFQPIALNLPVCSAGRTGGDTEHVCLTGAGGGEG